MADKYLENSLARVLGAGVQESKKAAGQKAQESILIFEVGNQSFAIGVESTEGVVECPSVTPLPNPPDGVMGVASVRGRMTVVLDLSNQLPRRVRACRLILIKGEAQLGLLAERIEGVIGLTGKEARPKRSRKKEQAESVSAETHTAWAVKTLINRGGREIPVIDISGLDQL